MMLVMGVNASACLWDAEPNQNVQLTFVETKELTGSYVVLSPLVLTEDSLVMPCLVPGIQVLGPVEYYLDGALEMLDGLLEFFPIKVLADIYEGVDLRGVPFKKADVKELEILPWVEDMPNYFPEGIEWKVLDQSGDIDISQAHLQVLSITRDTTIHGTTFHLIGGYPLRQEGQRIYLFDTYSSKDMLLYDFSLIPGDSILYDGSYVKVESIEQVTLLGGNTAKKINYIGRASDIEYVGSVSGLLAPYEFFRMGCYDKKLLCCTVGGELLYETSPGACNNTSFLKIETSDSSIRKLIQNGQLVILYNDVRYNIFGDIIKD